MSGSALSPWAAVQEPVYYAVQAARQLGCRVPDDLYRHYEALLHCLRDRTVEEIIKVNLEIPQFLSSIGPSVDGVTIRPDWKHQLSKMGSEGRTPVDLLLGVTATDVLEVFSDVEIQHGFEADHRDRLLRTFVTNNYRFHLQEIVLAITAEYTDWARPVQHPVHIRDLTAEALHDAAFVAPVTVAANHLYTTARKSFVYVLDYRPDDPDPEIGPDEVVNELVYVFGAPLGSVSPLVPPTNHSYTKTEVMLSEAVITMWTNFIKTGDPNEGGVGGEAPSISRETPRYKSPDWPAYDPVYRRYLDLGGRGRVRDHYRAGRVALWSWLVPGMEKVGARYGPDSPFHKLTNHDQAETYSGPTRPSNLSSNLLPPPTTPTPTSLPTTTPTTHNLHPPTLLILANRSSVAGLTEDMLRDHHFRQQHQQQDFPYTTALSLTVAIGCSLLVLNLLVFAAVYYRRDGRQDKPGGASPHESIAPEPSTDVQLRNVSQPPTGGKPSSPSQCGTLRSSATLRSSLAASCDSEAQHEWPPDYNTSVQDDVTTAAMTGTLGRPPHNGTARVVARPPPPPRSSSYPSHAEPQPLLSPTALLHANNAACSEMRV